MTTVYTVQSVLTGNNKLYCDELIRLNHMLNRLSVRFISPL